MSYAQKFALAAVVFSFPLILPFMLAKFGAGRFSQPRQKHGFIARVAVISYSLAIAVAFFISTVLRTFAPSMVTGHEPVAPIFNFLATYEFTITVCVLVLSAIGASMVLFPRRLPEAGAP
jgi:hypothetical protein